jgi:hypothetical protein
MEATAIFVAISVAVFVSIFLVFVVLGDRAAREKARVRRIAEAKMNARLLRLNL